MIEPMLLSEVEDDSILDKAWIYQIKENGVRSIIHVKDGKIVGIRGRSNNPLLYCYPEFKDVKFDFNTGILDAEIVVMKNGKSVFYDGVDKRRSVPNNKTLRDYPASIVVFDIIQFEQDVLVYKSYKDRLAILEKHIKPTDKIRVIESTTNGRILWQRVVSENQEGLVAKDPNGIYELGKRSKQFLKLKNYKFVDVPVERMEVNEKGTKIYANVLINEVPIQVEAQQAGMFNINVGDVIRVKYLDIVGDRLIQATRT